MIDYHCHLLPGIDDGADSMEESFEMARLLAEAGFKTVHCTPHCIRGVYDNTPEMVTREVTSLQKELDRVGIPLQVRPGMEYYLDEYFANTLDSALPLGETRLLLVEAPSQANPDLIRDNLFLCLRRGFTPLFAHPERYSWWPKAEENQENSGFLSRLRQRFTVPTPKGRDNGFPSIEEIISQGCFLQGNLGSFSGYYGPDVKTRAAALLNRNLYAHFGSDAHRSRSLGRILREGLQEVRGVFNVER